MEELKKGFLKEFAEGDIYGFDYLSENIESVFNFENIEKYGLLKEIIPIINSLSYLLAEYEDGTINSNVWNILSKYNINDFYIDMKNELLDILGVTDKELEEIFG